MTGNGATEVTNTVRMRVEMRLTLLGLEAYKVNVIWYGSLAAVRSVAANNSGAGTDDCCVCKHILNIQYIGIFNLPFQNIYYG